jgi:hypothetical protein
MYALQVARWMLSRILGTAVGWLWMTGSLLGLPLLRTLTPEGILGDGDHGSGLRIQTGFLAVLAGMMLALSSLYRNDWLLELSAPPRRLAAQAAGLHTAGLAGLGLVLLSSGIPSLGGHSHALQPGELLTCLLSAGHLAALALVLLQLPAGLPLVSLGLPVLGWILPALVSQAPVPGLVPLLAASRSPFSPSGTPLTEFLAAVGPILFWTGLAILLAQRRSAPARPLKR